MSAAALDRPNVAPANRANPAERRLEVMSNAVAVAVFEAWRQNGYAGGG